MCCLAGGDAMAFTRRKGAASKGTPTNHRRTEPAPPFTSWQASRNGRASFPACARQAAARPRAPTPLRSPTAFAKRVRSGRADGRKAPNLLLGQLEVFVAATGLGIGLAHGSRTLKARTRNREGAEGSERSVQHPEPSRAGFVDDEQGGLQPHPQRLPDIATTASNNAPRSRLALHRLLWVMGRATSFRCPAPSGTLGRAAQAALRRGKWDSAANVRNQHATN